MVRYIFNFLKNNAKDNLKSNTIITTKRITLKIFVLLVAINLITFSNFKLLAEVRANENNLEENKTIEEGNNLEENEIDSDDLEDESDVNYKDEENNIEVESNKEIPTLNSTRYVVFDRLSKTAIYGKDYNKESAMASTTKIMTAIVVLECCKNLNEMVTVDSKAANIGGSRLGLKLNDKITVNDLLYGLLMRSGNDAAIELADYIAGSKEEFANLMNKKTEELGLTHTHFISPHGLDNENHYTTAFELAKITDYALNNEVFKQIVKTQYKTIQINGIDKQIKNTNELLMSNIDGVYGVKTGFTNNAGRCLVTAVKRNNIDLIIVVLGASSRKNRANDTLKLMNYIYSKYRIENIEEKAQQEYKMWKDINEKRIYIKKANTNLTTKLDDIKIKQIVTNKEINIEINFKNSLELPIEKNSKIGELIIKNGDDILEEVDILANNEVRKRNIVDYLIICGKLISG